MKSEFAKGLPKEWRRFAQFFSALGDTTRQQIMLVFDPGEEICVNEIARLFSLSRPAISHHLKVLRDAELLTCEKRGKEVYYRVNTSYCTGVFERVYRYLASNAAPLTSESDAANRLDREATAP